MTDDEPDIAEADSRDAELAERVLAAAMSGSARASLELAAQRRHRRYAQVAAVVLVCVLAGGLWAGVARTPGPATSSPATEPSTAVTEHCYEMVLRDPEKGSDVPARCVGLREFVDVAINQQCETPTDAADLIREAIRAIGLEDWDVTSAVGADETVCAVATVDEPARAVTVTNDYTPG